jgi:hypothetical protein
MMTTSVVMALSFKGRLSRLAAEAAHCRGSAAAPL